MVYLSQNKKIAVSALAIFLFSFVAMLGFLQNNVPGPSNHGSASVLDLEDHHEDEELIDDSSPGFMTSADGLFLSVNELFCLEVSENCQSFIGESLFDHVKADGNADLIADYARLIQDGESVSGIGPVLLGTDMEAGKLILLHAKPVLGENGKVKEIVFEVKDLTKQVKALK